MRATEGLRKALEALPLDIDDIQVSSAGVHLDGYPDGPRPTSTVALRGRGVTGYGEHVGWTASEHEAFREHAAGVACASSRVGPWCSGLCALPPYDRAALEAAAIDLALRQHGTSLPAFARASLRPVRYLRSFGRAADPLSLASCTVERKIDVDPDWTDAEWRSLADAGNVAVLDFKLAGNRAVLERARAWFPEAWFEDPPGDAASWPTGVTQRWSADAPVTSLATLEAMSPRPAAVNVKAPRLGGVLEALSCLEWCVRHGCTAYVGGMFEIGIARRQSLVLAALFTPEGPNDIAPLGPSSGDASSAACARGDAASAIDAAAHDAAPHDRGHLPRLLPDAHAPGFAGDPSS